MQVYESGWLSDDGENIACGLSEYAKGVVSSLLRQNRSCAIFVQAGREWKRLLKSNRRIRIGDTEYLDIGSLVQCPDFFGLTK